VGSDPSIDTELNNTQEEKESQESLIAIWTTSPEIIRIEDSPSIEVGLNQTREFDSEESMNMPPKSQTTKIMSDSRDLSQMFVSQNTLELSKDGDRDADGDGEPSISSDEEISSTNKSFRRPLRKSRNFVGGIVNDIWVQRVMILLIVINAIMMGVGTFDFITDSPERTDIFEKTDLVFLIVFTVEAAMQLYFHGIALFLDGWLVFDFVIISLSWAFAGIQVIRAFRVFRAFRLLTRVPILKNLTVALLNVIPRISAIAMLLALIMYIFAVMFTQMFKDMYELQQTEENFFSRLDSTFLTLFSIMTLDAWSECARDVMDTYTWAWLPFVTYVIISGFVVVNLIIAVICDAISSLHGNEKKMMDGESLHNSVEANAPGTLTLEGKLRAVTHRVDLLDSHIEELAKLQEQTMLTMKSISHRLEHMTNGEGSEGGQSTSLPPVRRLYRKLSNSKRGKNVKSEAVEGQLINKSSRSTGEA
jgi:hypothetical protein